MAAELSEALEKGDRILIMYVGKGEPGVGPCQVKVGVYTRNETKVSWLEFLMVLQMRLQIWIMRGFADSER